MISTRFPIDGQQIDYELLLFLWSSSQHPIYICFGNWSTAFSVTFRRFDLDWIEKNCGGFMLYSRTLDRQHECQFNYEMKQKNELI